MFLIKRGLIYTNTRWANHGSVFVLIGKPLWRNEWERSSTGIEQVGLITKTISHYDARGITNNHVALWYCCCYSDHFVYRLLVLPAELTHLFSHYFIFHWIFLMISNLILDRLDIILLIWISSSNLCSYTSSFICNYSYKEFWLYNGRTKNI